MANRDIGGDYGGVPAPPMFVNPYDLGVSGGTLSPFANVDPSLLREESEFIFPTDSTGQRSWGEKLLWSTGSCYLSGLTTGSLWGLAEGLARPQGRGRLRLNSVLNGITRRGPFLANNIAVVALMYRLMDCGVVKLRGKDDPLNKVGCAVATGLLYKCTAGTRPMLIGGSIGLAVSLASVLLTRAVAEHWIPWM